ncbi:hypothetical protein J3R30DRAFT_3530333 [Lentinula aciculospora]|uniref:Uncharacterized protein n=1 Tax=Lentinula aciculospora TaxID=153920 RepID=A0A9W9A1G3_9AGAR|nr:hypothetical protein J3R30DRAFT_3530333 [Lentinula aciculospora]
MFILRYGVAFIAGYILIAAHTLPTSISRKSLSFPTFGNAKEPKWLIESNDYPKIKPQDLKAFFSSELILEATGAQKGGQRGRDSDLHATSSNDDLLAIKHITNHKGRSGNMIVNFLRKKQPTNVDYAKVQVLKDINEYVDSGKIAGLGENPAFIMNGNSAGTKSVPLEEVKFSNAQKKQAKKEIANLACDKVIEVAKKYHVFYM